jgi:hypothetical protein
VNANIRSSSDLPVCDFACKIDVFDIRYQSHGDGADLAGANRLRGQGPSSAMIGARGGAWIADDGFVNKLNDSAGAAVK